jgi:predicted molibdopterin-dependent oxidoreductase YjgC
MKTEIELKLELEKLKQTATLFLKKPDKSTRSMVNKLVAQDKYDRAVEACLKALYVGGDDLNLVLNNDDAIESAGMGVVELLTVQKAILKKN